jgi:S-adenosylmethionine hydrolase
MPIITLTTDWGLRDYYLAAFKGELMSRCSGIQLVDISHEIEHFNILQASFVIKNCYSKFPKGTLHFIGISGTPSYNEKAVPKNYLLVKCNDHFFTGIDSGIFSLILSDSIKEIFRLPISENPSLADEHNLFLSVIADFVNGKDNESIGTPTEELVQSYHTQPTVDQSIIRGSVIYIDSFDNIISNITQDLFQQVGKGRPMTIFLRKSEYDIHKINKNYFDTDAGEIVALFNREGYLKLAINHGKASGLLGMNLMDTIRIEFTD